jgi:hypothetical protein
VITGGNQFNTLGTQILIAQPVFDLTVSGNLIFIENGQKGLWLDAAETVGAGDSIVNNNFTGESTSGTTGLLVSDSNPGAVVTGNTFNTLGTGVNLTGTGGWNVQANTYNAVVTLVANIGVNSVGVATK